MPAQKLAILITGASRGIGRKIACVFSEAGPIVEEYLPGSKMVLMARDEDGLEETKSLIRNKNLQVCSITADLSKLAEVERATLDALKIFGDSAQYDGSMIVNNAGSFGDPRLTAGQHVNLNSISDYFSLNVTSVIYQTGKFCEHFTGKERIVINISSLAAVKVFQCAALYCSSKASRRMYFRCLAEDHPDILVLNYGPGLVATEMTENIRDKSGSEMIRDFYKKVFEEGTILQTDHTVRKLAQVVKERQFKSGEDVDYYDLE